MNCCSSKRRRHKCDRVQRSCQWGWALGVRVWKKKKRKKKDSTAAIYKAFDYRRAAWLTGSLNVRTDFSVTCALQVECAKPALYSTWSRYTDWLVTTHVQEVPMRCLRKWSSWLHIIVIQLILKGVACIEAQYSMRGKTQIDFYTVVTSKFLRRAATSGFNLEQSDVCSLLDSDAIFKRRILRSINMAVLVWCDCGRSANIDGGLGR